jgi:hypothetical protein
MITLFILAYLAISIGFAVQADSEDKLPKLAWVLFALAWGPMCLVSLGARLYNWGVEPFD